MTYREQLAEAIELARLDGYHCAFCFNDHVSIFEDPRDGTPIPDGGHWEADGTHPGCPSLWGGVAAWWVHNALWAAIEKFLFVPDYGAESWGHTEALV